MFYHFKDYFILSLIFWLSAFFLFTPQILVIDGIQYYAPVRSLVIDKDIQYDNEFKEICSKDFAPEVKETSCTYYISYQTETGHTRNNAMFGATFFWLPFFVFAHTLSFLFNLPINGYTNLYFNITLFGTVVYSYLALLLIYRFVKNYFDISTSLFAVIIYFLSSSFLFYAFKQPASNHGISLFTTVLFLNFYYLIKSKIKFFWILLGFISGLMSIVRWNNLVFVILPVKRLVLDFFKTKSKKSFIHLFCFSFGFLIAVLPQFIVLKIIYGVWVKSLVSTTLQIWPKYFFHIFILPPHGIILWTPITIFSLIGLIHLFRQHKNLRELLLVFWITVFFLSTFEYYHGGSSFGIRYLFGMTPVFILGLASFLERFKLSRRYYTLFFLPFIVWNLLLISQIDKNYLLLAHFQSFKEMFFNQFRSWENLWNMLLTRL